MPFTTATMRVPAFNFYGMPEENAEKAAKERKEQRNVAKRAR